MTTAKQIIINGVDVNGCICYKADGKYDTCGYDCEQTPNCYYKKWQRKEQECEYWKHQAELGIDTTDRLTKELEEKEQECEELKETCKEMNEVIRTETTRCSLVNSLQEQLDQLKAKNEDLKKCYKNNLALLDFEETNTTKLVNKVMKLEKTLVEIRDIAEKMKNMQEECGKCMSYTTIQCKQILQKISECEVENEQ